jgi:peptide/nickel transport system ATP-binding protein
MASNTLFSVDDLATEYRTDSGRIRAVDDVSFDVDAGEIVGIVGESGAGKSAVVKSILRTLGDNGEVVNGEVRFKDYTVVSIDENGHDPDMLSEGELRKHVRGTEIAMIMQDPTESLNPVYTVGSQIREIIGINRDLGSGEAREEAINMLREVGIPEPEARYDDYPHEFSGGMRQRVLIAMAIGCRPDLIIADEPTTALDVSVEGQILELIRDLRDDYGTSFIWVTHDMGVVAEICDRVNVMYLGKIVEHGPVDDIFHNMQHPYTEALIDSVLSPDERVEKLEPIRGVMPSPMDTPAGCRFHTRCPDARQACTEIDPEIDAAVEHDAACIKHDDYGYEQSKPLNTDRE